jgi:hypothetical protein
VDRVRFFEIPRPTWLVDDYPRHLEGIVMTALQRDPRCRFQSAGELEDALTEFVQKANADVAPTRRASARSLGRVMRLVFAQQMELKRQMLAWGEQSGEIVDSTRISSVTPSLGPLAGTVRLEGTRLQREAEWRRALLLCLAAIGVLTAVVLLALLSQV